MEKAGQKTEVWMIGMTITCGKVNMGTKANYFKAKDGGKETQVGIFTQRNIGNKQQPVEI